MIGAAYAGVLDMLGYRDRPPIILQMSIGDISGAHAAAAIGYTLLHRERTGKGQYVETSTTRRFRPNNMTVSAAQL